MALWVSKLFADTISHPFPTLLMGSTLAHTWNCRGKLMNGCCWYAILPSPSWRAGAYIWILPVLPTPSCDSYKDTRNTPCFRTQIHKFLICEKYKMKPCTSYVQTLFTRQESYHWLSQMTELGRSFQSTSIYSLLQFLSGHIIHHSHIYHASNQCMKDRWINHALFP